MSSKPRPARRQAAGPVGPKRAKLPGTEYNIWYHKTPGKDYRGREVEPASSRCDAKRDAGWTKGERIGVTSCCLHFARGCCIKGAECTFLHRVPTPELARRCDLTHDIFGRERHRDNKIDMGGVGSFEKTGQTLYVGGLPDHSKQAETALRREFSEWGDIERLNYIRNKFCCFVKYRLRASAEFAKEAMIGQRLTLMGDERDNREEVNNTTSNKSKTKMNQKKKRKRESASAAMTGVLNIRWAHDDPNPKAIQREKIDRRNQAISRIQQYQNGRAPYAQQQQSLEAMRTPSHFPSGQQLNLQRVPNQYPDTSAQYPDTSSQYPIASNQYQNPGISNQYPDTSSQNPNTSNQYLSTPMQHTPIQNSLTSKQYSNSCAKPPGTFSGRHSIVNNQTATLQPFAVASVRDKSTIQATKEQKSVDRNHAEDVLGLGSYESSGEDDN